jgi:hypothetical protein
MWQAQHFTVDLSHNTRPSKTPRAESTQTVGLEQYPTKFIFSSLKRKQNEIHSSNLNQLS